MRCVGILMLGCLFCAGRSVSGQSVDLTHNHQQSKVIDGSVNPELIPDLTAYRLYLLTVSRPTNPTDQEKKHQTAQLARIGLTESEKQSMISILASFHDQYQKMVASFNVEASAAWSRGEHTNATLFKQQRDQLVENTRGTLKSVLSADGWNKLDAHVHAQKKGMRISVKEATNEN